MKIGGRLCQRWKGAKGGERATRGRKGKDSAYFPSYVESSFKYTMHRHIIHIWDMKTVVNYLGRGKKLAKCGQEKGEGVCVGWLWAEYNDTHVEDVIMKLGFCMVKKILKQQGVRNTHTPAERANIQHSHCTVLLVSTPVPSAQCVEISQFTHNLNFSVERQSWVGLCPWITHVWLIYLEYGEDWVVRLETQWAPDQWNLVWQAVTRGWLFFF